MTTIWSILLAILIFGCIIAIHEFGHFIAAKRNGIQVNEFAIGMGPKIFRFKREKRCILCDCFRLADFVRWKEKMQRVKMLVHLTKNQYGEE